MSRRGSLHEQLLGPVLDGPRDPSEIMLDLPAPRERERQAPLTLTAERLDAEALATLEARSGRRWTFVEGFRLRPSDRAVLRFVGAFGGSCPRFWLNRIAHDPRGILQALSEVGLCSACHVGGGRQFVTLTEQGRRVLAALPLPGEPPPTPHPLRELARCRAETQISDACEVVGECRRSL